MFTTLTSLKDTKDYQKFVKKFREKSIPKIYNQIELVDDLLDPDLDHYISISNRADGKSYNYIHFFVMLSILSGVKFMLLSRNFTVRESYVELLESIYEKSPFLDERDFALSQNQFYKIAINKNREIGYISDLNEATNLKYFSAKLSDVGVIIYDEFIALENDYLGDEWERLKTIYSSVNRKFNLPLVKYPKIFYLGNAVNLSSPILAHLNIYNDLEKMSVNSKKKIGNIEVELRRNEHINEKRNLRAFREDKDEMTFGQFKLNNYKVATDDLKSLNYNKIIVKLSMEYLVVRYNEKAIVLGITEYEDHYNYNSELKDNMEDSIFLKEAYYDEDFYKKHDKGLFWYTNNYSKDRILQDFMIKNLNILRLIKEDQARFSSKTDLEKERMEDSYIDKTKQAILRKLI